MDTLTGLTLEQLVEVFEDTEEMHDAEIPTVRGWIMDELEKRNPGALERWLGANEGSPRRFFL